MKDDIRKDLEMLTPEDYQTVMNYWKFLLKESPNNIRGMREDSKNKGDSHLFYLAEKFRSIETGGMPGLSKGMGVNYQFCRNMVVQIRPVDEAGNQLDPLKFGKPPTPGTQTDGIERHISGSGHILESILDAVDTMDRDHSGLMDGKEGLPITLESFSDAARKLRRTDSVLKYSDRIKGIEIGFYVGTKQYKAQLVIMQDILPDASIEIPEGVEAADSVLDALKTSMRLQIIANMNKFVDDVIDYIKQGGEIGDIDEE